MKTSICIFLLLTILGCKKPDQDDLLVSVYIPSAFRPGSNIPCPDGDPGCNTKFHIVVSHGQYLEFIEISIFDQNGEQIWHAEDQSSFLGWDGTFKGAPMRQASYNYNIKVTDTNHHSKFIEGSFLLIR